MAYHQYPDSYAFYAPPPGWMPPGTTAPAGGGEDALLDRLCANKSTGFTYGQCVLVLERLCVLERIAVV